MYGDVDVELPVLFVSSSAKEWPASLFSISLLVIVSGFFCLYVHDLHLEGARVESMPKNECLAF